ncbi:MAG: hypothetical protein AB7S38_11195 [Vulcanimicrobiota bacterium]
MNTSLSPLVGLFANFAVQARPRPELDLPRDEEGRLILRPRREEFVLELTDGSSRTFAVTAWPLDQLPVYLQAQEDAARSALADIQDMGTEAPTMADAVERMLSNLTGLLLQALRHPTDGGPPADPDLLRQCSLETVQAVLALQDRVNQIDEIFEHGLRLYEQAAVKQATDRIMQED